MKNIIATVCVLLSAIVGAYADNISLPYDSEVSFYFESGSGDTDNIDIYLTKTSTDLVGFQMDLTLPEGISINKEGCMLKNSPDANQTLTIGKLDNNVYRLTSISYALIPYNYSWGNTFPILTISLTAAETSQGGTATLSNIIFVTSSSKRVRVNNISFNINVTHIQYNQEQHLALESLPEMTYGDSYYTLPEKTQEGFRINWSSSNTDVASTVGNYIDIMNAGTTTITAIAPGNGLFYQTLRKEFTLTVRKAPLTITANNCAKKKGEENPVFTVSYQGFKNADNASVLTSQPVITTTATKNSPVGTYPITVSGASANNYDISYVTGTLTIEDSSQGDVNGDGVVGAADVSAIINHILRRPNSAFIFSNADMNGDGTISAPDVSAIINIILKRN